MRQRAASVSDLDLTETAYSPRGIGSIPAEGVQPASATRAAAFERRQAVRVPVRASAELSGAVGTTVVRARDGSAIGAGLVSTAALAAGHHRFRLRLADGQTVDVGCTVERARTTARGLFEGYAKFDRPVDVFSHRRIGARVA
ncbi:MAG TPA: PilZ domain-containing protein [Tepidisphaeraceae bacterium]|nr:PilZ domain-containing protein [Tepidisphaeraceae bacterium]